MRGGLLKDEEEADDDDEVAAVLVMVGVSSLSSWLACSVCSPSYDGVPHMRVCVFVVAVAEGTGGGCLLEVWSVCSGGGSEVSEESNAAAEDSFVDAGDEAEDSFLSGLFSPGRGGGLLYDPVSATSSTASAAVVSLVVAADPSGVVVVVVVVSPVTVRLTRQR